MRTLIRLSIFVLVALIGALPLVVTAHNENTERTRELLGQYIAALSSHDVDTLMTITSEDFTLQQLGIPYTRDEAIGLLQGFLTAIPDFHLTPELILADGDWGAARVQVGGTFSGELMAGEMTLPPTNGEIALPNHLIIHVNEDGQIDQVHEVFDQIDFLTQLGAMPAPEGMVVPEMLPMDAPMWEVMEMSEESMETTRANVTRVIDEFFNAGDSSVVGELFSEDAVIHPDESGVAEFIANVEGFRAAMPDFEASAEPIIVDGNWVAFYFTGGGTFSSDLGEGEMAIPATGQPLMLEGIIIGRLDENGILVEEWDSFDNLSIGMQLGLIPPMGA